MLIVPTGGTNRNEMRPCAQMRLIAKGELSSNKLAMSAALRAVPTPAVVPSTRHAAQFKTMVSLIRTGCPPRLMPPSGLRTRMRRTPRKLLSGAAGMLSVVLVRELVATGRL
jgi:hypothetical protein